MRAAPGEISIGCMGLETVPWDGEAQAVLSPSKGLATAIRSGINCAAGQVKILAENGAIGPGFPTGAFPQALGFEVVADFHFNQKPARSEAATLRVSWSVCEFQSYLRADKTNRWPC